VSKLTWFAFLVYQSSNLLTLLLHFRKVLAHRVSRIGFYFRVRHARFWQVAIGAIRRSLTGALRTNGSFLIVVIRQHVRKHALLVMVAVVIIAISFIRSVVIATNT
jgi:hypothetical protein